MLRTASGRELTLTCSFRLPISLQQRVLEKAEQRGVTQSEFLREIVAEKLSEGKETEDTDAES